MPPKQKGLMRSLLPKRNIPLTDADLASLEELLFNAEAVESRERFEEVCGKNLNLKLLRGSRFTND
ncbi:hypothetical protein IQ244_23585 [Nostoc sp. LEGE 06077]|uniref:hypothetical protein n=1 Tax=Nostoc sp. LEGE 06077 TaxID=915325 RepID=UPI0018826539|nr:hypothetical protein [Nostoc sp. LEGE 06077]MBE9209428.1 hypothetical protein [Nostoc sp. LEGE 06077]